MSATPETVFAERLRIRDAYGRRPPFDARYAPWNLAEEFMRAGRRRRAIALLSRTGAFPRAGDACLEVGCGALGWLADLLSWGLRCEDLHGIDLDPERVAAARAAFPGADVRAGDATALPWGDGAFRLVIASTVFSSVLDEGVREAIASEIARVLAPGGALLLYDLVLRNPKNPDVRPISRAELRRLFPALEGSVAAATLAPPLARLVAPRSAALASALEAVPLLRSHLLAVLVKENRG